VENLSIKLPRSIASIEQGFPLIAVEYLVEVLFVGGMFASMKDPGDAVSV
jgi:hypothetical protein